MRLFQLGLVALFFYLQYLLWFGHNGIEDYTRLRKAVASHELTNQQLSKRNKLLEADIQDLKLDLEGVEERARHELGMIKPGEVFYRVLPSKQSLRKE
ncbi:MULTISPECIES: cell division protein FtsB [Pseudoalteromonas]|uniref:Cell division protein FtsB n=1 Tax=Pseudoalteromonas ruthenica TaxID=151081 RepID=A0A0F4PVH9_9GAMM|nr:MULTISPECIES: cell division protein FtsB [Pseudoalteromonas]KJY97105.1 cell division protein FtsB [Pseudoalteromonas ruthenica]KJY99417.1 cell division protein FtsB [Pseudoalteromonas ruthenica]MCF2863327.1 cell division protein FtsB [Pseudoalteromonas sp. CNAT2-18]MCG7544303.1 cell division protein FtsB [Pseudoalteromonas sp. MM17-2]MCG7558280.1 cell division protein FtsB [Pseudoalteromonas sp. CNAT2-18.1]|tara:strand:- start:448 stop:741 length:294 start_codon:yes stop_codon:yes gene_type:complete